VPSGVQQDTILLVLPKRHWTGGLLQVFFQVHAVCLGRADDPPLAAADAASPGVLHEVPLQPDEQVHTPGAEQFPLTHPAGQTARDCAFLDGKNLVPAGLNFMKRVCRQTL
jgi:hypothetical protein